jgi:1-phosphatidylinositol-4-phosphate 5-kinase
MKTVLKEKGFFGLRPDYRKKEMYSLQHDGEDFFFMDYAPCIFFHIRKYYGITQPNFIKSLIVDGIKGGKLGAGKSGMLFFFSNDRRYVIKTITRAELKFFRKVMRKYFEHMKANPNSTLPRFFAMFKLTLQDQKPFRIIVMNNLFDTPISLHEKFDLKGAKHLFFLAPFCLFCLFPAFCSVSQNTLIAATTGSTRNRYVDLEKNPEAAKGVLKDLNFKGKAIKIGAVARDALLNQLRKDTDLLIAMVCPACACSLARLLGCLALLPVFVCFLLG